MRKSISITILLLIKIIGAFQVGIDYNYNRRVNTLQSRHLVDLGESSRSCYTIDLKSQNQTFRLQVATSLADTILPSNETNGYLGPNITYSLDQLNPYYSSLSQSTMFISPIKILTDVFTETSSTVLLVTNQSNSHPLITGSSSNGYFGVGFSSVTLNKVTGKTLFDDLVSTKTIAKNQVAFHGCPSTFKNDSWIDIGNETPYSDCGGQSVTFKVKQKSYLSLDLTSIDIAGNVTSLPSQFQADGFWSSLDSCFASIRIPDNAHQTFVQTINGSYAFSKSVKEHSKYENFINGQVGLEIIGSDINWNVLPNITFSFQTDNGQIDFTLGPHQYLDQYLLDGKYYYFINISGGDRDTGRLDFQLGCGCASALQNYPVIRTKDSVIEPIPAIPEVTTTFSPIATNVYSGLLINSPNMVLVYLCLVFALIFQ